MDTVLNKKLEIFSLSKNMKIKNVTNFYNFLGKPTTHYDIFYYIETKDNFSYYSAELFKKIPFQILAGSEQILNTFSL